MEAIAAGGVRYVLNVSDAAPLTGTGTGMDADVAPESAPGAFGTPMSPGRNCVMPPKALVEDGME